MAYYTNGLTLASQGMHRDAIDQFRKAVTVDPFFAQAYLSLSKSYYAVDNYDFALFYNVKYYEAEDARGYTYNYRLEVD
jgi:tetratricopeptide (TPR) repeat protein